MTQEDVTQGVYLLLLLFVGLIIIGTAAVADYFSGQRINYQSGSPLGLAVPVAYDMYTDQTHTLDCETKTQVTSSYSASVLCSDGYEVNGGGVSCSLNSNVVQSYPLTGSEGWYGRCSGIGTHTVYVVCCR